MFDNIERPELKRFAEGSNGKEWLIPTTVEEDMRRNDSADWNIIPTTVTSVAQPKVVPGFVVGKGVHRNADDLDDTASSSPDRGRIEMI
ncbi:hypothetical protein ANCCAN_23940 [Ancylostoma caninum]|uniref:Uncharacterized protein n=1 Tax=Ancylostoma caninum TaxID=29170 RepID=A0A368FFE2_ANCCA|nr:hypothetical protein ANCCAN_23940 [Ancylostoma caninum]